MPTDVAASGKGGWNGAVEDTTTAIAAALSQVGRLRAGEAAEFDTRVPHRFGSTGDQPAEILSMFGPQGENTQAPARTVGMKASAE